jgi:predicted Fe-Mo cluster-binding NifX family protein
MTVAISVSEVTTLRIAIPIWEGRVSPVFDVAERLLLVDVDRGREVSRSVESIGPGLLPQRIRRISDLGIGIVICGTVSRQMTVMLSSLGITVFPCMRGEVDDVLNSVVSNGVPDSRFFMPGYDARPGRRRRRGRRGRSGWC